MRVHVPLVTNLSKAMTRVENALRAFLPVGWEDVSSADADLVVMHVIGYPETEAAVRALRPGQRYALIQYCMRSTQKPDTSAWERLWRNAACVWSYYDLAWMIVQDGGDWFNDFAFYRAPLGVDPVFNAERRSATSRWSIITSGYVAESEAVHEAEVATALLGRRMLHLGPIDGLGKHVTTVHNITDVTLAELYRDCAYVAGLRRCEGFELPAAEGLLCGARPICFDRPHYRDWYGPWARFIPEGDPETVIESLENVLSEAPVPLTVDELAKAREAFSWARIIPGFWRAARREP